MHGWMTSATPLSHAVQCVNHDDTNLTNKQDNCALTCQCSCALFRRYWVLVVTLSLVSCSVSPRRRNTLDGHDVTGVVLSFTTQTPYQQQIKFPSGFCSSIVFCHRQFLPVTILHTYIAKTGHLRCCLYRASTSQGLVGAGTRGLLLLAPMLKCWWWSQVVHCMKRNDCPTEQTVFYTTLRVLPIALSEVTLLPCGDHRGWDGRSCRGKRG